MGRQVSDRKLSSLLKTNRRAIARVLLQALLRVEHYSERKRIRSYGLH
jgi:hypothetical protein